MRNYNNCSSAVAAPHDGCAGRPAPPPGRTSPRPSLDPSLSAQHMPSPKSQTAPFRGQGGEGWQRRYARGGPVAPPALDLHVYHIPCHSPELCHFVSNLHLFGCAGPAAGVVLYAATRPIEPGEELVVDYGERYFMHPYFIRTGVSTVAVTVHAARL